MFTLKALPEWKWHYDEEVWTKPEPEWQQFLDFWSDPRRPKVSEARKEIFSIGPFSEIVQNTTKQEMYVRECYGDIYERIHLVRHNHQEGGVLLTGQPGIGTLQIPPE